MEQGRTWGVLTALVAACSASGGEQDERDLALEGTWTGECAATGDGGSVRSELVVSEDVIDARLSTHADDACGERLYDLESGWDYRLDPEDEPWAIDVRVRAILLVPRDPDAAAALAEARFCGHDGWAVDEATEVTGLRCGELEVDEAGTRYFARASLDGDELVVSRLATADDDRPDDLDGGARFRRSSVEPAGDEEPAGEGPYYCFADGEYRSCSDFDGDGLYTSCYPRRVTGAASGPTEQAARADAILDCGRNMLSMISINNIGGEASISRDCAVTRCATD
jgi:hypothetical protein